MNTYELLEAAREGISDEATWCQGMAENVEGARCALGAIDGVLTAGREELYEAKYALVQTLERTGFESPGARGFGLIADFNDLHSHAEVVALFQETIRREKAKAGIPLDVEPEAVLA